MHAYCQIKHDREGKRERKCKARHGSEGKARQGREGEAGRRKSKVKRGREGKDREGKGKCGKGEGKNEERLDMKWRREETMREGKGKKILMRNSRRYLGYGWINGGEKKKKDGNCGREEGKGRDKREGRSKVREGREGAGREVRAILSL